jgi:hypothetical protein
MNISESGRYLINYKAQYLSQALEYGIVEITNSNQVHVLGLMAKIRPNTSQEVQFALEYSLARRRPAGLFAKQVGRRNDILPIFAWNGGPTFDRKLISRLGLEESYLGNSCGLLIYDTKINGIPIFNHHAVIINEDRSLSFHKVGLDQGISLACNSRKVSIPAENRNLGPDHPNLPDFVFYDADYPFEYIPGNGRSVIFLGGTSIREIYHTPPGVHIPYKASGLALSIADAAFPPMWDMRDKDLEVIIPGLQSAVFGVEAGPAFLLHQKGNPTINYHQKWQEIFYPDLSVDKAHLLCGTDADGNILIVTLLQAQPGKKGLAFHDLPEILENLEFKLALMMDDGNGSSLYRGIERIHITENDHDANFNPFSDAPQPGTASNALIAY